MKTELRLIKLYRTRRFGEKISDTFDFIRENWRPVLKYTTYLLLPVALIEAFCMAHFMTGYEQSVLSMSGGKPNLTEVMSWASSFGVYMLLQFAGSILLYALLYTMMQLYEQRADRLQNITFDDLRSSVIRMCGRGLVLLVSGLVPFGVIGGLVVFLMIAVSPLMFLLAVLAFPLFVLAYPIYLFEQTGIISAYAKSVRLGWKTWAGIVGVLIVLYIIFSILSGLVSTPWYIMVMLKDILSTQDNTTGFISSFGYTAIQYLLGVVSCFFGYFFAGMIAVGIAYQYGHACDKVDGVSVDRDIENFETL